MKNLILLCSLVLTADPTWAGPPAIVGPPTEDASAGVVRVQVGNPPWVPLTVKDAPAQSVQTWSGPIGEGQVGAYGRDGLVVSTAVPGTYPFRCIIQVPSDGLDTITFIEATVVVEGVGPIPVPIPPQPTPVPPKPVPPQPNVAEKITEAVKANPDKSLAGVAEMYDTVGNQAAAGGLTIPQIQASHQLASALSPAWATISGAIVDPYLKTLTLAKPGDYAPIWHQIAAGIKAGLGPQPPPNPVDPPIPAAGLKVLIIEETADRNTLPASQVAVFTSAPLRKWLTEHNAEYRMFDKDVDLQFEKQVWKDAMKLPRQSVPWIIVSNGTSGFSGPLPKTVEETITLLEKYK